MRFVFLFLGLFLGLFWPALSADAALLGQTCSPRGLSKMDDDGTNLIACVKDAASGKDLWKAMTNGEIKCPAGQVLKNVVGGQPECVALSFSCPSGQAITNISNGVPTCGTVGPKACGGTPTGVPTVSVNLGQYYSSSQGYSIRFCVDGAWYCVSASGYCSTRGAIRGCDTTLNFTSGPC
ncbi:MAG: hypothetical protein WC464_04230 [Bdellovibrionales bacterium]